MGARDLVPEHPAELTLLDYLCGSLAPATSDQVRKHIATCRDCRQTMAELSSTVDDLDRLPTTGFFDARGDGSAGAPRPSLRIAPVIALALLLLGALVWLRLDGGGTAVAPQSPSIVTIGMQSAPTTEAVSSLVFKVTGLPVGAFSVTSDRDHPGRFLVLVAGSRVREARQALKTAAINGTAAVEHATLVVVSTGSEAPPS
jgi:anti-sigma factor RsiW